MWKILVKAISLLAFKEVNTLLYRSELLGAKLKNFPNNDVSFTIKERNDEKFSYLSFEKEITLSDDLQILVKVTRQDGVEFQFPDNPSGLCRILEDRMLDKDNMINKFNIPNAFSLIGRTCPIEKSTLYLTAPITPSVFELKNDIGCGTFNITTNLSKCDHPNVSENCRLLMTAETRLEIMANHCSNTFE